jgi:menaquinone reductase, molybdopterin-binding-like subunit
MSSVTRRDFLKLVGAGSVGTGAGFMLAEAAKRPVEQYIPYVATPEDYSPGIATWYHTVCGQCPAGCGISVRIREGRAKKIEGNPAHPVSQGRLCALGQAGLQALYNPDRIQTPLRRTGAKGSGQFEPITWDAALGQLATQLGSRGADTRMLTGAARGHTHALLDEFLGAIGAPPYVQYDALSPEALYAANRVAFGIDVLPYYDVRNADLVVSFGADLLGTWLSPVHHGLAYGHLRQGEGRERGRLVQIEPRMSLTGANADVWLPARPGTEGLLALALAHAVLARGRYGGEDRADWASALADYAPERVAERCGLDAAAVQALADEFARSPRPLALGGGGAASGTNGGATLLAVNALNHLSGSLGVPGGVLANPPAPIPDGRERRGGHAAVLATLEAAAGRTLIVHGANPAFTLPAATGARAALAKPELLVCIGPFMDETAALADLVLPTHTFLESWWDDAPDPGVGFPVASIAQPVVTPLYDTRSFGDIVLALAARMGGSVAAALPAADMQAYLKQAWGRIYAARRDVLEQPTFDAFWSAVLRAGVWGEQRADVAAPAVDAAALRSGLAYSDPEFDGDPSERPFVLHPYATAAFHDGRGANLPWMQELPDPLTSVVYATWIEMNPATARELGIEEGDLLEVQSSAGALVAPAFPYHSIRPDVVAIPIGQGHAQYGRYASGRGANPLEILAPKTDALSGALATGATRVALRRTGERVRIAKTDGVTRTLGRQILRPGEGHGTSGEHGA